MKNDRDSRKSDFIERFSQKAKKLGASVRKLCEEDVLISFSMERGALQGAHRG